MTIMTPINCRNILITGGSGFIGRNFLQRQALLNANIFCIRRLDTIVPIFDSCDKKIQWIYESQLTDIPKIDAVLHLATSYGRLSSIDQVISNDVVWPLRIFQVAMNLGCKKIINIDSFFSKDLYSYGYMKEYILAKKTLRECLRVIASTRKVKIYNAVLEHVYGPSDNPDKFINSVLLKIISNTLSVDLTAGNQTRDFIYINDVIDALITLIIAKDCVGYQEIGIGTGLGTSLKEFFGRFKAISKSSTKLNFGVIPYRDNEIMESVADIKSLLHMGWTPKIDIDIGLKLVHQNFIRVNNAV
jgi:CDP-paratose synthetase